MGATGNIVAFAGGVGGGKLAAGLARALAPGRLTIVVNTADDFEHLGLHVSPDLDSVMYALAGMDNEETGWGIAGETWSFMDALARLGEETWFRLGDRDLATHIVRTRRLRAGATLSEITAALYAALGIAHRVAPMTDDPVRTAVVTDDGTLDFQDYFVRRRAEPRVRGFEFRGADLARPAPAVEAALADPALAALVLCPSNPFVSIAPILAVPAIGAALRARRVPLVAVSPIVAGKAVKGPAMRMMLDLGIESSALGIARHYGSLVDGLIIDRIDAALAGPIEAVGTRVRVTDTIMRSADDKARLAGATVEFARTLAIRR
jgi:LPPG:FO 2-phospho-L-lactate transferase